MSEWAGRTPRRKLLYHIPIFLLGFMMVYPLIWMVFSSFKPTNTIFTTANMSDSVHLGA